jgi:hypothetical protein
MEPASVISDHQVVRIADRSTTPDFTLFPAMRSCRFPILVLAACSGAAHALSIDGDTQLHAAVGQALGVSVPISLAGDEVSRLYYRLTPAAGLADAEERAAAAVHASYDPNGPAIVLSTAARVNVPAMRLHLEVGAGSVVVSRDLTVLFDVPDLSQSAPLDAAGAAAPKAQADAAAAVPAAPAAPDGARGIAITREETQKTARTFGDSAAQGSSAAPAASAPKPAGPQLVVGPRPKYFNTYQVKSGDTLDSIGLHFAHAGAGSLEAVMLAVYEANYEDFPAGDPHHPIVGRQLGVPDAASIASEPEYRVTEFKDYLRKPLGEWQIPVNLQRKVVEAVREAPRTTPGWLQSHNLIGAAVLVLLLWGLRALLRGGSHKRAVRRAMAMNSGVGAAVVAPNLIQNAPAAQREQAVELVVAPPPETEQTEISRLRELLRQQPGRADIRLRLAQRLFEARRAAGFAEVALPLEQVLSPEAWERVRMMGHELLPSDFRFQPQAGLTPAPELVSLMEKKNQAPAAAPASGAAIDFDFHGEMARVDKARADVFGKDEGKAA